jgi:hypothetical protein
MPPTRKNQPEGPHFKAANDIFTILAFAAEHQVEGQEGAKVIAENICDMLNLFSMKEMATLQKKNKDFFEILQMLFQAIGQSHTTEAKTFLEVCKHKLNTGVNKMLNSGPPPMRGGAQAGGARGDFKAPSLTFILFIIWLLMVGDLMVSPGNAITLSIIANSLTQFVGIPKIQNLLKDIWGAARDAEYPIAYAEGRGVITLSGTEGAKGRAYDKLVHILEDVEQDLDVVEEVVAEAHVAAQTGMLSLVSCAATGTCSFPSDAIVGAALAPLAAADAARPRLSIEQAELEATLESAQKLLKVEEGKYRVWNRNETKIAQLTETVRSIQTQISATNTTAGLVASLPGLSNAGAVAGVLQASAKNVVKQITPANGSLSPVMRLESASTRNVPRLTNGAAKNTLVVRQHRPAKAITSEALVAAGIQEFSVDAAKLVETYGGSELDILALEGFAQTEALMVAAQRAVGTNTKVDKAAIERVVDAVFNGGKAPTTITRALAAVGAAHVSKGSAARETVSALVTEAAGVQAGANARIKRDTTAQALAVVLDHNTRGVMEGTIAKLVDRLVGLNFPGGRAAATRAAGEAIDISRLFGVAPNMDTNDYATAVISCNSDASSTCPKKPYTEMRNKAELLREMATWGVPERFQHVKWNIMVSALFMLPVGLIADAILLTAIGTGGFVGRWTMWGVKERELRLQEAEANTKRRIAGANAEEQRKQAMAAAIHARELALVARAGTESPRAAAAMAAAARPRTPPRSASPPMPNARLALLKADLNAADTKVARASRASSVARSSKARNAISAARDARRAAEAERDAALEAYIVAGGIPPAEGGGRTRKIRR